MRRVCPVCRLDIAKNFPEVDGRLCPSCYKKNVGACMVCEGGPVEIIEYHRVYGLVILGFSGSKTLVACPECTRKVVMKNLVLTAFFGWIGLLPFYRSFRGQLANLRSLFKHPSLSPRLRVPVTALAFAGPILLTVAAIAAAVALLQPYRHGTGGGTPSKQAEEFRLNGEGELAAGHFDLAEAWFRKALHQAHDFPPARLGLGRAVEMLGRLEEAEDEYRRALAGAEGVPYPQLRQSLAKLLMKRGRAEEAAEVLRSEVEWDEALSRDLLDVHRLYQDASVRCGKAAQAAAHYGLKAAELKDSAAASYLFGRMAALSDPEVARTHFRASIAKDPKFFTAAYALCRLEIQQGNPGDAIKAIDIALSVRPRDRNAVFSLGEGLVLLRDAEAAEKAFLRLHFDLDGGEPLSAAGRAMLANAKGDFQGAIAAASAAATGSGAAAAIANRELGIALGAGGKTEDALAALRRASDLSDDLEFGSECAAWAGEINARLMGRISGPDWEKAAQGQGWPGLAGRLWTDKIAEEEYLAVFESGGFPAWAGHGCYFAGLRRKLAKDADGAAGLFAMAAQKGSALIARLADSSDAD